MPRDRRARRARASRPRAAARFLLRILPYRAKGRTDGVVLTLIDVSGLKAAEDALFHERYLLNSLLEQRARRHLLQGHRAAASSASTTPRRRASASPTPREAVGKDASELAERRVATRGARRRRGRAHARGPALPAREPNARGRHERWDLATRLPLNDREERVVGVIGIFRDVTEQKHAEEDIQRGRAPARPVPRHALPRAAQPPRRHRHATAAA